MRILHAFKTYWPDTFGGMERVIHEICEQTNSAEMRCDVIAVSPQHSTNGEFQSLGNHRYASYGRTVTIASTDISLEFFRHYKDMSNEYDLLHYHFPWPFIDFVHTARRIRKPYIITYHADIIRYRNLLKPYSLLMNRFLSGAQAVVATSQNYSETSPALKRFGTHVIPIGISENMYTDAAQTERVTAAISQGAYLLTTGVYRHYKGFERLIHLASQVKGRVIIVASGPKTTDLKVRITASHVSNLTLIEDATEGEKITLLKHCTGFVLASDSRAEAYGVSLVEAAMFGKPLVSCEIGTGTSFVNQHSKTGIVVPLNDNQALLDAMNVILTNMESSKAFGHAARAHYENELRGSVMGRRYLQLYEECLRSITRTPAEPQQH